LERLGWCRVQAAGAPVTTTQNDSEQIAMQVTAAHLTADGFSVADIHTEGRGYDLHATRGPEMRMVEVKGVWNAASSDGIRLTGHEILIASQHADDYWIYVVDRCAQGGQMFGAFDDPVRRFGGLMGEITTFKIPGSTLTSVRDSELEEAAT
ncbi:MAG: DUF3883 domain-containing protein, partial [bacterium]